MDSGQPVTKGSIAMRMGLALAFLVVLAVALSQYFLSRPESKYQDLGYKTLELVIQVFFVGIAGGMIVQEYNRGQARRTAFNESRKAALRRLVDAYSRTKKIRRNLRAHCKPSLGGEPDSARKAIAYEAYQEQFDPINTTQLELELLARELKTIRVGFSEQAVLREKVMTMERALNKLISEFERTLATFSTGHTIPLERVPLLDGFIAKSSEGEFSEFFSAFTEALDLIQKQKIYG